jgi:Na+-translocating ferredoxin:NAD+ oxidoreductase RnfA subunit
MSDMSEMIFIFLDQLLKNNLVLISFTAVLLIIVETPKLRAAFKAGTIITGAMGFAAISAWIFSYYLNSINFVFPAVYFLNSLISIKIIKSYGLLQGEWISGLKREIIALAGLLALQFNLIDKITYNYQDLIIITASLAGFYLIFIIVAAIKEQLDLKENKKIFKKEYTLFLVLAFLAALMSGFDFL